MSNQSAKNLQGTPHHITKIPYDERLNTAKRKQCYFYNNNDSCCRKSLGECYNPLDCSFFIKIGTNAVSNYIINKINLEKQAQNNYTLERNKEYYFKKGMTVYHKTFGKGIIKCKTNTDLFIQFGDTTKCLNTKTVIELELLKPYKLNKEAEY